MAVPYTFGTATAAIPLSQLDSNFATAITIGNTAVQLGNTVTTLNNMTLANVTISSGTVTLTNVAVTTANVSGTANISTLVVVGNETVGGNTTITGNITAANANVTTNLVLSGGTANGVAYLNGSKVLTTGSALVFDGTNLGIGTTSPSTYGKFVAYSSGGYFSVDTSGQVISAQLLDTATAGGRFTGYSSRGALGAIHIEQTTTSADGGYMAFRTCASGSTSTTERARIDSSGNLLVGTTNSSQVAGVGLKLKYSATEPAYSVVGSLSTSANSGFVMYSTGAGAYRFYVDYAGTIFATSTSISAISDQTLKTNVRDLETGLSEVLALKPRRFDWINGDATNVAGFVAQEVEEILPELVSNYKYNTDAQGNDIFKKSLKMGDILPTLVKAIQEQQALITTLTDRITALEAK